MKYPRVLGWSVVITTWVVMSMGIKSMQKSAIHDTEVQETINTAEDMVGWIVEDVANERLDSTTADTYIDNLEGIIINLGATR